MIISINILLMFNGFSNNIMSERGTCREPKSIFLNYLGEYCNCESRESFWGKRE
jgi:hypothetical protein